MYLPWRSEFSWARIEIDLPKAQGLYFTKNSGNKSNEPSMFDRNNLHSDGQGFCVIGGINDDVYEVVQPDASVTGGISFVIDICRAAKA